MLSKPEICHSSTDIPYHRIDPVHTQNMSAPGQPEAQPGVFFPKSAAAPLPPSKRAPQGGLSCPYGAIHLQGTASAVEGVSRNESSSTYRTTLPQSALLHKTDKHIIHYFFSIFFTQTRQSPNITAAIRHIILPGQAIRLLREAGRFPKEKRRE